MSKERNLAARRAGSATGRFPGQVTVSGGFLQIFGLGVLIIGHSGIGKSESALELISRGHRFISDDVVEVIKYGRKGLIGKSPQVSRYFMEIRGLGIINIKEIFGRRAICRQSRVDLVIKLKKWQRGDEHDRLGLEFPEDYEILGTRIPQLIVPVAPGRTIALLIEVACKVHLLRLRGYHASHEIVKRVDRTLSSPKGKR
jgi:HPr kinase/phosphorylase